MARTPKRRTPAAPKQRPPGVAALPPRTVVLVDDEQTPPRSAGGQPTVSAWRAEIQQAHNGAVEMLHRLYPSCDVERFIAPFQIRPDGSVAITKELESAVGHMAYPDKNGGSRHNPLWYAADCAALARFALALHRPTPAERERWLTRVRAGVTFLTKSDPADQKAATERAKLPRTRPEEKDHRAEAVKRWETPGHERDPVTIVARHVRRVVCKKQHPGLCKRLRTVEDHIRPLRPKNNGRVARYAT